jgi:iron complex transport system permease protein
MAAGYEMLLRDHTKLLTILFVAGILLSIPIAAFFGSANLGAKDVFSVLMHRIDPSGYPLDGTMDVIIWNLRIPRILLAIAVGGGLSVCGVTMQATTRNVMAEPYTLGVASGASAMAAVYISRIDGVFDIPFGVDFAAFLGAMLAMMLVYVLASRKNYASNYKLILTGIVIGMIFSSFRELIVSTTVNPNKVNSIVLWEMGGFGAARWDNIFLPIAVAVVGVTALIALSEQLNLLSIGEQTAVTLGVSIKGLQRWVVIITSLVAGTMVASSGIISFVGLIVPHITRKLVGSDNTKVMPISAFAGALFMIWVDVVARIIIAPEELAIGVLTSLIGGPFLLILMRKERV